MRSQDKLKIQTRHGSGTPFWRAEPGVERERARGEDGQCTLPSGSAAPEDDVTQREREKERVRERERERERLAQLAAGATVIVVQELDGGRIRHRRTAQT